MTGVDPRAARMPEDALEEKVREICTQLGVYRYHTHDARRSQQGFPDDVLIGPHGILYRELKSERGTVSPDQARVHALLAAAGADVAVWRPGDWLDGTIARQITAISTFGPRARLTPTVGSR